MNQQAQQQQQQQHQTISEHAASPALAEIAEATALKFSAEERSVMRDSFAKGASESEFRQLCAIAEARGLHPLRGQCHFVKRWNAQTNSETWQVQVSIDGMRGQAEATGLYDGQDEPEFEYDAKGAPVVSRVRVYRKGWSRPAVGVVRYEEVVQTKRDGTPNRTWSSMRHTMLAKCAEAQGLRKAFPLRLGSLFTDDEGGQVFTDAAARTPDAADEFLARISVCDDQAALAAIGQDVRSAGMTQEQRGRVRDGYTRRQRELKEAAKVKPQAGAKRAEDSPGGVDAEPPMREPGDDSAEDAA